MYHSSSRILKAYVNRLKLSWIRKLILNNQSQWFTVRLLNLYYKSRWVVFSTVICTLLKVALSFPINKLHKTIFYGSSIPLL